MLELWEKKAVIAISTSMCSLEGKGTTCDLYTVMWYYGGYIASTSIVMLKNNILLGFLAICICVMG